jgi:signal peptidase I
MATIEFLTRLPVSTIVWTMLILTVVRLALFNQREGIGRFLNDLVDALVYAGIFVFLIIRPFFGQSFYIPSGSMIPTLQIRDVLVVDKLTYHLREPERGEIVVFRAPDHSLIRGQIPGKTDLIKRLIGKPGDVIEIKEGEGVYRNDELLNEPYVAAKPDYSAKVVDGTLYGYRVNEMWEAGNGRIHNRIEDSVLQQRILNAKPEPIPDGKYLMLGDNRQQSSDSHEWGLLEEWRVVGRAIFRFFPFNRIGRVK